MNMKPPLSIILLTAFGLVPALADSPSTHGDPYTPVGSLNVTRLLLRTGVKPMLSWEIEYPQLTLDVVMRASKGGFTPKVPVLMQIRVAGKNNNGHGNNLDGVDVSNPGVGEGGPNGEVDESGSDDDEKKVSHLMVSNGSGGWVDLLNQEFIGNDSKDTLYSAVIQPGELIDLAAQVTSASGESESFQWSQMNNYLAVGLVNGDPFPTTNAAAEINGLLSPYVDDDRTVVIGPREMLCVFELNTSDPASDSYDLQDLVVVITFKDVPSN
jgi:hypothetical protein